MTQVFHFCLPIVLWCALIAVAWYANIIAFVLCMLLGMVALALLIECAYRAWRHWQLKRDLRRDRAIMHQWRTDRDAHAASAPAAHQAAKLTQATPMRRTALEPTTRIVSGRIYLDGHPRVEAKPREREQ